MTAQVWEWDGKWTEASPTPFICNLFTTQYDRNVSINTLCNISISISLSLDLYSYLPGAPSYYLSLYSENVI